MKTCATCKRELPATAFHRKADAVDGLYPYCKECRKAKDAQYRLDNQDRFQSYDRERYQCPEHKAASLAAAKQTYARHRDAYLKKFSQYAKDNPEVVQRAKDAYKARNPHKVLASTRRRQAGQLCATPKWSESEFEKFAIEEMYDLARRRTEATGFKWHVDHAVPLRNKTVCGLHCVANLQVIPAATNMTKGNRVWPDMPTAL